MMMNRKYQALFALLIVAAVSVKVLAHGDEDHAGPPPAATE